MSPCPSLSVVALLLPLGSSAVSMSCVHWAAGASQVWELQRQARCFPCMKEVPRCFSPPGSSRAPAGGEHPGGSAQQCFLPSRTLGVFPRLPGTYFHTMSSLELCGSLRVWLASHLELACAFGEGPLSLIPAVLLICTLNWYKRA